MTMAKDKTIAYARTADHADDEQPHDDDTRDMLFGVVVFVSAIWPDGRSSGEDCGERGL